MDDPGDRSGRGAIPGPVRFHRRIGNPSRLAQDGIDDAATADVLHLAPAGVRDVGVVTPGVLSCIGEDRHPLPANQMNRIRRWLFWEGIWTGLAVVAVLYIAYMVYAMVGTANYLSTTLD